MIKRKCLWKSKGRETRIVGLQKTFFHNRSGVIRLKWGKRGSGSVPFGWKYLEMKPKTRCFLLDDFSIPRLSRILFESSFVLGGGFKDFCVQPENWGRWTHFDKQMFQVGGSTTKFCQKVGSLVFWRFLGYEARNMEKRAQTTLLKQKLGEIKEPLKDTSKENLANGDPEKGPF